MRVSLTLEGGSLPSGREHSSTVYYLMQFIFNQKFI